jgi:16S rRNA processing protein RimM
VRGEVRLKLFNADSDVLLDRDDVLVRFPDGEEQEVSVDAARRANDAILMKFHKVDDRDRADEMRGALVCVRRGDFPPTEDGEFYTCDAVGARVVVEEGEHKGELGTVREIRHYPTVEAVVVRAKDGGTDWEVPLVQTYISKIDLSPSEPDAIPELRLTSIDDIER